MTRRLRFALIAPLLAGLFVAPTVGAQLRVVQPAPDCRLARYAIDQPFWGLQYRQRRYMWHIEYFALAHALAEVLHRMPPLRLSPVKAAIATDVITADVPHIIGLATHAYPLNPADVFLADPIIRSAPLFWVPDHPKHPMRDRVVALLAFGALYAAIACFASP